MIVAIVGVVVLIGIFAWMVVPERGWFRSWWEAMALAPVLVVSGWVMLGLLLLPLWLLRHW